MKTLGVACGFVVAASLFLQPIAARGQGMLSIEGTATYRERIALPPDAVFEVTLEDVSRMDAPALTLGQSRTEQPGNPPFHFIIQYDPSQIQPNHIYAVRASITEGDRLLFTTDQRYQVLTQGHGSEIGMMMLRRVGGTAGQPPGTSSAPLRETYWKLTQIEDKPVTAADQQQEANLVFHTEGGRVTGSGGCNRLTGGYTVAGESLRFGGVASTRMACMRGMETETNFLAALERVRSWKIASRQLELLDEEGKMLLRFTAQAAKTK